MQTSSLNQKEKGGSEHWLSSQKQSKLSSFLLFLVLLLLPTQLGFHTWPPFAFVAGQRLDYLSPTFYLTDVFIFCLFLLSLRNIKHMFSPLLACGLLFLAIGIFLSLNPLAGWWALVKLCEFIFFGWYIACHATQVKKFLFPAFAASALLEVGLACVQFLLHRSVGGIFYFLGERFFISTTPGVANASIQGALILRPYGTFSHPNVLGGFMVVVSIYMLWHLLAGKQKLLSVFLLTVSSATVLISLSRLAFVGWIIGLSCLVVFYTKKHAKKQIGLAALASVIAVLFIFPLFAQRLVSPLLSDETFLLRLKLLQAAAQMLFEHPFFGVGLNNFFNNLPTILPQLSFSDLQPVHNIYFLIGAQAGLVGLGVSLWLIGISLRRACGQKWLLASLITMLFLGLGDHYLITLQQGQLLFTLLVGLAWQKEQ